MDHQEGHKNTDSTSTHLDVIPENNKDYSTREYWEARYKKDPKPFDWFKDYVDLKVVLSKHINNTAGQVLMVGCGNSQLSEQMYTDGYFDITNIDFSGEVIKIMKERCKSMEQMKWLEMDVMNMNAFENEKFDVVIDKGTLDAILCEQTQVWKVEESIAANVAKMMTEISRKYLLQKEEYKWNLQVETVGEFFHYFVFVMHKAKEVAS